MCAMTAIILSIGDELVLGQTVDTNSPWLSQQLAAVGCRVLAHLTVGDDQQAIEEAIRESARRCDLLLVTGGLGPTADDLTRQALAAVMDAPLELDPTWLAELEDFFRKRGRSMPLMNRIQAMIPRGATMIFNTAGTAAGIRATLGGGVGVQGSGLSGGIQEGTEVRRHDGGSDEATKRRSDEGGEAGRKGTEAMANDQVRSPKSERMTNGEIRGPTGNWQLATGNCSPTENPPAPSTQHPALSTQDSAPSTQHSAPNTQHSGLSTQDSALRTRRCEVFVMPGVPKEMRIMFERDVLPYVRQHGGRGVILSRTLHTFGLGESWVGEKLGELMRRDRNPSVGTTVSGGIVSLRINARFDDPAEAARQVETTEAACRAVLGDLIFGADDVTLAQAVAALLKQHPLAQRWAPAVCAAESCTGGLLAKYLTDVPGSSAYFRQGWVTYSNEAKISELGVRPQTLERFGAVSEQTVREMAEGAARRSGAPFALAISGIAGPEGGTAEKPVGTVCIALSAPHPQKAGELEVSARTFNMPGDRDMVRDRSAKMAMTMLRYRLLGRPMPF